ncbi:DUF2971 domain-containing protein [Pseudomonas fragi]|uniref:DUF2971 domain-containing protein n=1 Tax=Pseudomonas fragi TaxID=296 RepID=UPI001F367297|nr:DUF2971 domain-containing protein [Pseudomonas fragi]MCF6764108.1 DUF2971 domain-containing protein [Pseudomonas fragi]
MEVEIVEGLADDTVIWRYMSIDKFINLLEDSGLFFSPLSFYKKSDPFEGYPPSFIIKLMYSVGDKFHEDIGGWIQHWDQFVPSQQGNVKFMDSLESLKAQHAARPLEFRNLITKTTKSLLVNCWYGGSAESEAMWKLYGEANKGVAIRSTVGRLKASIENAQCPSWVNKMFIGRVKYLDYSDTSLRPQDCMVGGHISPLLKRSQYAHENEIRCFLISGVTHANLDVFEARPYQMEVDIAKLVERVYISPYVDVSYAKAVHAISRHYNLQDIVTESTMLKGEDELFAFLNC